MVSCYRDPTTTTDQPRDNPFFICRNKQTGVKKPQVYSENNLKPIGHLNKEELDGLSSLFDLLARFDHEDRKKETSGLGIDPLAPAPRGSILGSDQ